MKPGRHADRGTGKGTYIIGSHVNDLDEFNFYETLFGSGQFNQIIGNALRNSAKILKKNVTSTLKSSFPQAFHRGGFYYYSGKKIKVSDRMADAVRIGKLKGGLNHQEISVHILGTRKAGSGTWRLRFYEAGGSRTKRGSIPGYHFFDRAHKQVNMWSIIKKDLDVFGKSMGWI